MTDSVWWYVLAGLLFGFILSTLWEWLYFRQRRMRIKNRRIAELEATVRTLSAAPRSVENTTSPGLAAGYQSLLVFLEGEVEDVDTVEVIVPATLEPVWSTSAHVHNGYGVVHETPDSESGTSIAVGGETSHRSVSPAAVAAAAVAATAAIANDKDQTSAAQPPPAAPMSAALVSEPQVQANQAQVPQAAAPQATQAPGVQVESEPQEPEPSSDSSGKKPVRVAVLASALWSKLKRKPKEQQQASPTEQAEAPDLSGAPQPATIPDTPPPVAQVSASEPSASATTPADASSPADQDGDTAPGTPDAVQHPAAVAAAAVAATAAIANDKDQTSAAQPPPAAPMSAALVSEPQVQANQAQVPQAAAPQATQAPGVQVESEPQEPEPSSDSSGKKPVRVAVLASALWSKLKRKPKEQQQASPTEQAEAPDLSGAPQPATIPDTPPPVAQVSASEPSASATTPADASSPADQDGDTAPGTPDAVQHPAAVAAAAVAATAAIANDKDQTSAAQPPPAAPMSAALVSEPQVQANQAQVPQAAAPQATQAPGVQVESEPQEPEPSSDSSGKKPVRVAVLASALWSKLKRKPKEQQQASPTEQAEAPDLSGAPQPATIPDTPPPVAQVSASEPSASATTPADASSPADQDGDTAPGTPDAVQHPAAVAAAAVAATAAIANDKDQTSAAQPPPAAPMSAALVSEPQVQANQAQVPQAAAPQATQAPGVQVESEPQEPEPSSDSSGKKPVRVAVLASALWSKLKRKPKEQQQASPTEQAEAPDLSGAPQPATIPDTPPPVAQVSASEPSASATTPADASSPADQDGDTAPGTPDAVQHPAAVAAAAVAATAAIANDKDQTSAAQPPPAAPMSAALVSEPQVQANQAQVPQAAAPQATQAPGVQVESEPQEPEPSSDSSGKKPVRVAVLASALWSKLKRKPKEQQQASPTEQAEAPDLSGAPQPATIPDTPPPVAQVSASEPSASATTPTDASSPADQDGDTAPGTPDAVQHPAALAAAVVATTAAIANDKDQTPAAQPPPAALVAPPDLVPARAPDVKYTPSEPSTSATTPGTALETQPGSTTGTAVEPAVEPIVDAGEAPSVANNQQGAALPLSAILPRATKPAPLSKSGQTNRQETQPVTTLAASGLEPKLEQVSNQLGDLAASLSELIETFDQVFNGQRPGA